MSRELQPPQESDRVQLIESWMALGFRACAFCLGSGIMVWQTLSEKADRPYLIAAAMTMMGLPVAGWIRQRLEK